MLFSFIFIIVILCGGGGGRLGNRIDLRHKRLFVKKQQLKQSITYYLFGSGKE
jgi:hypothetical protein